jgi:hypothetical protein
MIHHPSGEPDNVDNSKKRSALSRPGGRLPG